MAPLVRTQNLPLLGRMGLGSLDFLEQAAKKYFLKKSILNFTSFSCFNFYSYCYYYYYLLLLLFIFISNHNYYSSYYYYSFFLIKTFLDQAAYRTLLVRFSHFSRKLYSLLPCARHLRSSWCNMRSTRSLVSCRPFKDLQGEP